MSMRTRKRGTVRQIGQRFPLVTRGGRWVDPTLSVQRVAQIPLKGEWKTIQREWLEKIAVKGFVGSRELADVGSGDHIALEELEKQGFIRVRSVGKFVAPQIELTEKGRRFLTKR